MRGNPFYFEGTISGVPVEKLPSLIGWKGENPLAHAAGTGAVAIAVQGKVTVPTSWRGGVTAEAQGLALPWGSGRTVFDPAEIRVRLADGRAIIDDFFMHGDRLALRGRGWASVDGGFSMGTRIYVDAELEPGLASALEKLTPASPLSGGSFADGYVRYLDLWLRRRPEGDITLSFSPDASSEGVAWSKVVKWAADMTGEKPEPPPSPSYQDNAPRQAAPEDDVPGARSFSSGH